MLHFPLFRLALLLLFPVSNSFSAVLDISVVTQPDITLSSSASNVVITVNGDITTTIDTVASTPITCLGSDTGIDTEYILDYISYFCSSVSASQPDILIKVTSDEGNVDIIYAWEAAGDNYDQSCSTVCADAFNSIVTECEYDSHNFYGSGTFTEACGAFVLEVTPET